jgi:hypothetical protein
MMWFEQILNMSRRSKPIRNWRKKPKSARPLVEPLETRDLPAAFTPGDLIILQAGDGTSSQTTGALFLNEIHTDGTTTGINSGNLHVAIPNDQVVGGPGNQPITIDLAAAAGNGQLTRSADGSVLSFAGLDAHTGDMVSSGHTTFATGTGDRVIGVATNDPAASGFLDTTTHGQFYVGDDARGAVLVGPTGPIYAIGHPNQAGGAVSNGVHYFPTTGPSIGTQVSASTNIRGATIGFDNRAYFSTATIAQPVNTGGIFTDAQALPTVANPAADIEVVPSLFSTSKLGGVFLADMNGTGILSNGDRLYFLDDGTVGGDGSGGLYVATWDVSNTANPWNTPNNLAAVAAGLTNHWSTPVRLGDAPVQDGSGGVGQLRGLTGTVISPTEVDLYTTAFDNTPGDSSYVQQWVDTHTGLGIANAQILSGTTAQITTLIPLPSNYTTGSVVQVDGIGTTTGAGVLNQGYNGAWTITVTGTNTFTYNDTNSGASSLGTFSNQGGTDVTVTPTNVLPPQANGTVTIGDSSFAAIGLRGVAFAPVAATTMTLDVSVNGGNGASSVTVSPGTNVTFNATLTNPEVADLSGLTVTFIDQNTNTVIGTGIVGLDGVAHFMTTTPLVGNHIVQAYFAGGGLKALASARSGSVQVFEAGYADSLTTVSPNLSSAAIGRTVTFTATVSMAGSLVPTGTVSFYSGSVNIGNLLGTSVLSGASATLTTPFSTAGTQTIFAVYNGDNTFEASQNSTSVTIAPNATASVTSSANNVALNSVQTFTATINGNSALGTPGGTVVFHLVSATNNGASGAPSVVANSSPITLSAGPNNTATALWTAPALSAPGSYFITVDYTPAPAATTPYVAFSTNTLNDLNGLAFIETVKQAFTPGNLIAVQRGDGNTNLGSNAYLVFLDEYTQGGALVQKIAMPNADSGSTHGLFTSGQTPAEGLLNRSANGYYLTLAGYDPPVGRTFVTSTFPYQYPRTIALVDGSASVDTSTTVGVLGSTGIAATISGATASGTNPGATVTITTSTAHNFKVGQQILISDITTAGYNGSVVITAVTPTTFTYTDASAPADTTAVLGANPAATPSSVPYNPVDVVTNDGKEFWLLATLNAGNVAESGIAYIGHVGSTASSGILDIGPAGKDGHSIGIAGGQLYVTQGDDIQAVGSNLPTTAGQTLTGLPGLQAAYDAAFPSPFPRLATGFLLLNTNDGTSNNPNVVYIADQANGLLKFYKDGSGNWNYGASGAGSHLAGTFGEKLLFAGGVTSVVGYVQNPGPSADVQLYVTGSNVQGQNANRIAFFDDVGPFDNGFTSSNPNFADKALVGATFSAGVPSPNGNENFAGLAFAPGYVTSTTLSDTRSGSVYTFTAHVSSAGSNTPTGVVLFYLDGAQTPTASGTLDGSGNATYSTSTFPAGTHTVTAVYQGDVLDGTSTGTLTQGPSAFSAGNLIATVVGTGSALNGNGTATFINEYSTSGGAAVQSIGLPTSGVSAFTEKGTSTSEGYLTTAADGHTASFGGYNVAAGTSTSSTNSPIGVVNPNGSIESSMQIAAGDTGGSIRAVASADGLGFWVATANYIRYVPFANTSLTGTSSVTNYYPSPTTVEIGNGNLYVDGGAGAQSNGVGAIDGPAQVGSGLPNVGGQAGSILAGFPTGSAPNGFPTSNQFAISPDGKTIFVADSRPNAGGGILEFYDTLGSGFFTDVNSSGAGFPIGTIGADSGLLGLSVDWSVPSAPVIYATTTAASGNRIVKITGGTTNGSTPFYSVTTLETAADGTAFRGVALAPKAAGATGSTTALTVSGSPGSYPGGVSLSATVTGANAGTPTGYVSFQLPSGKEIGAAPLVSGTATLSPASDLLVGYTGTIKAVYTGDATYTGSTGSGSATITKDTTTTALTAQFTSVATGISDTLTAKVTYTGSPNGAPTGSVTFWQDAVNTGINLGTVPVTQTIVNENGVATIEYIASTATTFTTTGLKHMFAVYSGDGNFQTSQGTQDVTVVLASTTTVTTNNIDPTASSVVVRETATVTGTGGTPTGTVQFYVDLLPVGSPVTLDGSGQAFVDITTSLLQQSGVTLLPGLQSITAIYSGSSTYFQSSGVYEQAVQAQPFGAGDVFVYRVGDGTTGLIAPAGNPSAGTAAIGSTIYLDEINPAGTNGSNVVQSIILPTADGQGAQAAIHAIVGNGQQSATGQFSVSGDGNYLFLVGYDNNPLSGANASGTGIGTTALAIPTGSGSAAVPRAVARIDLNGNVQDVAFVASVQTGGNFNGVYSSDGNQFYVSGGGVDYFASFTPSAALQTATAHMTTPTGTVTALEGAGTDLALVNSATTNSNPVQTYTGFPAAPASANSLPGVTGAAAVAGGQASQFTIDAYFTHLDNAGGTAPAGINTMYLSDDGPGFSHGAITKWALVSGSWVVVDHITAGTGNSAISFYYLSGSTALDGPPGTLGAVTLYAAYGNGGNTNTGPGQLYQIIDTNGYNALIGTGGTHSDAAPLVAHVGSSSNEAYRGVAAFPVTDLTGTPTPVTGTEAVSTGPVEVATFVDPLDAGQSAAEDMSNFIVTIDWGDGTGPDTTATLTLDPDNVTYHVMGMHTYAEDSVTPYPITVTIKEAGVPGRLVVNSTATIAAADVGPFDLANGVGVAITTAQAQENVGFTATVATFTDPVSFGGTANPVTSFQAMIDWGDGTPPSIGTITIVNAATGAYSVSGTHTYAEATVTSYQVTVTITELSGGNPMGSLVVNTTADVAQSFVGGDNDITGSGVPISATTNAQFTGTIATFTDPVDFGGTAGTPLEYQATIDWGDGTTIDTGVVTLVDASLGLFSVTGTHTYTSDGMYTVVVTITEAGISTQLAPSLATVSAG